MKANSASSEKICENAENDQRESIYKSTALCIFKED